MESTDLVIGDIIAFENSDTRFTQTALYVGDNEVICLPEADSENSEEVRLIVRDELKNIPGIPQVKTSQYDKIYLEKYGSLPQHESKILDHATNSIGKPVRFENVERGSLYYATKWRYGKKKGLSPEFEAEAIKLPSASPGDIIFFIRNGFFHTALYLGAGKILNVPGEDKTTKAVKILEESFWDAADDEYLFVVNHTDELFERVHNLRPQNREAIIRAARADQNRLVPYCFTECNCEFYCSRWRYGVGVSFQVTSLTSIQEYPTTLGLKIADWLLFNRVSLPLTKMWLPFVTRRWREKGREYYRKQQEKGPQNDLEAYITFEMENANDNSVELQKFKTLDAL